MSSKSIYTLIKPTYLYIKQHSITGLKYFGKTTRNPHKYSGSGTYWSRHVNKHGKEHIITLWVSKPFYDTSIVNVALSLSEMYDIVESKAWANMKPENGLDGGFTSEQVRKQIENCTHPLIGGLIQKQNARERVTNGTHHLLGGKINNKRIKNGTHNLLGGATCRDKSGKVIQVPKEIYHSQSGDKSDWEFVHINSTEGKNRKV